MTEPICRQPEPGSGPAASRCRAKRAFLGLGSNVGDRAAHLRRAVASLDEVVAVSPVYETAPVGGPPQGRYLNVVVELRTCRTAHQLLAECRQLEEAAGRRRTVRFGPRTLDVDVLLVGDDRVDDADLVVPHPRMWERRFVLVPLADLAPDAVSPAAVAAAGGEVRRIGTLDVVDPIA